MFAGSPKLGPDFDCLWRLLVRQKSASEWRNSGPDFV